jgi:hypothetical protein
MWDATNPGTRRDAWAKHNPSHGATLSFNLLMPFILPAFDLAVRLAPDQRARMKN